MTKITMPDIIEVYDQGYKQALMDIAEKLNNAKLNGYEIHAHYELIDQLAMLADENEIDADITEFSASGMRTTRT